MKQLWTAEQDQTLHAMVIEGKTYREIADALGRSYQSVKSRVLWIEIPAEVRRDSNRKKRERQVYKGPAEVRREQAQGNKVSPEAIEDRNRRLMARTQMDLTGMLMGDPAPGCSALERRT